MEIPEVVLLDIDGTLVDYDQNLPASAAEAVRAARARGHGVYLCTGRSRAEIYDDLWELGVDGLIGGNGSYVEAGGVVVHHQVLDPEVAHRAVEWMLANDLAFYLECNSGLYGTDNLPEQVGAIWGPGEANVQRAREGFPQMIYGTTAARDDINKISFVLPRDAGRVLVDLAGLAEEYAGAASVDTWSLTGTGPEFGEFGQLGVHKGAAVHLLADHLGISTARMAGFGDARSDIELLTTCGVGVAMGNAAPELLEVADLVTAPVNEDGLAKAFVRLGLIEG